MLGLNIGIISQTLVQQHHLREIAVDCGHQASSVWLINQLLDDPSLLKKSTNVDIWLVYVDTFGLSQNSSSQAFKNWLFALKQPVIFGDGTTYNAAEEGFNTWTRQLKSKIEFTSRQLSPTTQKQAGYVWVLAASTGGPEAVKAFLDHLPTGLDIGFLYVQHIESHQKHSLATTITRDSEYTGLIAQHGDKITADSVIVVPSQQEMHINQDGTLAIKEDIWRGKYQPSIDMVVASIANIYGACAGAIFFSGMGEDGVVGSRLMAKNKGRIWTQSLATCTSDNMPAAIEATGCVTAQGAPTELAEYLQETIKGLPKSA
jgi:chemosensory pili system protein ChpB (putative protein-glutamate methylesterase)